MIVDIRLDCILAHGFPLGMMPDLRMWTHSTNKHFQHSLFSFFHVQFIVLFSIRRRHLEEQFSFSFSACEKLMKNKFDSKSLDNFWGGDLWTSIQRFIFHFYAKYSRNEANVLR